MATGDELPISTGASADAMAAEIFGDGVTVVSASYTGDNRSSGTYSDGIATSPGVVPGDTGVILSTGRASSFTQSNGDPNRSGSTSTNTSGQNNNADFNAAAGTNTYDASYLDVSFTSTNPTLTMQFVFASEEYPEYVASIYQDFVGVWVNGTQVDMSVGDGDADPGNINSGTNENLFVDNTGDDYNTEMDGFTVTMTLTMNVSTTSVNTIRIGVADVGDSSYDSNLLIAGGSIQSSLVAQDDNTTLLGGQTKTIDVLGNDNGSSLTITHINGNSVSPNSYIDLPTGQRVYLNGDGTLTLVADTDDETFNFTYTIDDGTNSDTAFVHVSGVPCFVAGSRISTPDGDVPVETLQPGDLVDTHENGPQELRWIGSRVVPATGDFAPIRIEAGAFGDHDTLMVSPQHRILIRDCAAELWFGEEEVLVPAKALINDGTVRRIQGGEVEYVHLMFDDHQIVYSERMATESFLPGPQTTGIFEKETLDEICALFPELDPGTGRGYGAAARRVLKGYEAELLFSPDIAA